MTPALRTLHQWRLFKRAFWLVALMLPTCAHAEGVQYGVEMGLTHYLDSNVPAHFYDVTGPTTRYVADVTVHASWHHVLFAIEPMIDGYSSAPWGQYPSEGGMYVGIGTRWHGVTVSLFHHSAHNLDAPGWNNGPSVNMDGARLQVRLGSRMDFQLW